MLFRRFTDTDNLDAMRTGAHDWPSFEARVPANDSETRLFSIDDVLLASQQYSVDSITFS